MPYAGPGYKFLNDTDSTALPDAASQILSLCLTWHADAHRKNLAVPPLTPTRIGKIRRVWRRYKPDAFTWTHRMQRLPTEVVARWLEVWDADAGADGGRAGEERGRSVRNVVREMRSVAEGLEAPTPARRTAGEERRGGNGPAGGNSGGAPPPPPALDQLPASLRDRTGAYADFILSQYLAATSKKLRSEPLKYVAFQRGEHKINPGGLWLEFGVAGGKSLRMLAGEIASHDAVGGVVHGFDSFEGLPEPWRDGFDEGAFGRDCDASGRPQVTGTYAERIHLVEGWFEDTLPSFLVDHTGKCSLLHIDSDLYSSASFILRTLMADNRIIPGTVIVFDELLHYSGFECHEMLALFEAVEDMGLRYDWIGINGKDIWKDAALRVTEVVGPRVLQVK